MNDDTAKANVDSGTQIDFTEQTPDKGPSRPPRTKIQSTYALPSSGPEILSKILKAYVIASKQGAEAIKYTDVAAVAGLNPTVVSRNNSFLADSGFIVSEKYGYYKPSPDTIEFAKHAPWDEVGARKFIRKQIDKTWFGETVRQQFQMFETLTRPQQVKAFGIKALPDESDANKVGFLFDFLVYFDYITTDEKGNYYLHREGTSESPEGTIQVDDMVADVMRGESPREVIDKYVGPKVPPLQSGRATHQIHVNINITPSTTDEELQALVRKAKLVIDSLGEDNV
jgi:hypothetical protein